jgi:hypothetical protein
MLLGVMTTSRAVHENHRIWRSHMEKNESEER